MTRSRGTVLAVCLVAGAFVLTRAYMLSATSRIVRTTLEHSADLAMEWRQSLSSGESFHEIHLRNAQRLRQIELADGGKPESPPHDGVEYPPLAILWMVLPSWPTLDDAKGLNLTARDYIRYAQAHRVWMAGIDLLILLVLVWTVNFLYAQETPWARSRRLLIYIFTMLALTQLVYDRMDLVLGSLILLSLALLIRYRDRHYIWSYFVLAAAINFKISPVVLGPLWILGAMPPGERAFTKRWWKSAGWRALILVSLTLAIFLPFTLVEGKESFAFLRYHAERGLQVESILATPLMLAKSLGGPGSILFSHDAYDFDSPLGRALAVFSPWLMIGLVALAYRATLKRLARDSSGHSLVFGTLVILLAAMIGAKVFSPQYLFWIVPLLALLPLSGSLDALVLIALLSTCVLTLRIYPGLYLTDIVFHGRLPTGNDWNYDGPTVRGALLLSLRNLIFIFAAAALFVKARRRQFSDAS